MRYQVTVTRTESAVIEVEADDEEGAEQKGYAEAIEDYESQVWETMSIDVTVKEGEGDEEEDEETPEDEPFAALTELNRLARKYRGCGPV